MEVDTSYPRWAYPHWARRLLGVGLLVGLAGCHGDATQSPTKDHKGSSPDAGTQQVSGAGDLLQFRVDEPLLYHLDSAVSVGIADRPDLKQEYRTRLEVRYRPISNNEIDPTEVSRPFKLDPVAFSDLDDTPRILAEVRGSSGSFHAPASLKQPENAHQLMRQAKVSFELEPSGRMSNMWLHEPMNPLARTSMGRVIRSDELIRSFFPNQPVSVGDTWSLDVPYGYTGSVATSHGKTTYLFKYDKQQPCAANTCAYITYTVTIEGGAKIASKSDRAQGMVKGSGEGWISFNIKQHKIEKSYLLMRTEGKTAAAAGLDDAHKKATSAVRVQMESTFSLIRNNLQAQAAVTDLTGKNPYRKGATPKTVDSIAQQALQPPDFAIEGPGYEDLRKIKEQTKAAAKQK